jgi:hypothetical protein
MSKDSDDEIKEMLDEAKKIDFDALVIIGIDHDSEAHMMHNVDSVSTLQILELFRSNLLTTLLTEMLDGGKKRVIN